MKLKEALKEYNISPEEEILIGLTGKQGRSRTQFSVKAKDVPYDFKIKDVLKIRYHAGGMKFNYNGKLFILD